MTHNPMHAVLNQKSLRHVLDLAIGGLRHIFLALILLLPLFSDSATLTSR